GFAKSALHIRQKCPGSQALGAGIHLAHTAGAAGMRIQIGIQIPEISVGGSPHKARRIDRMSKVISRTEIRTGITLAAGSCCSLDVYGRSSALLRYDHMVLWKDKDRVCCLCHRL